MVVRKGINRDCAPRQGRIEPTIILTLWYKFIITKECKGDNFLIVYADDFVTGFQYKWEAENYYKLLKERMEKFGLQLEEKAT